MTIFNKSNSDYNYIIYKSLNNNEYYTGKYKGNKIEDLDRNLSEEEIIYVNSIFNDFVGVLSTLGISKLVYDKKERERRHHSRYNNSYSGYGKDF